MRIIMVLFVVTLVDFRARTKWTCSDNCRFRSTHCISCYVPRKDNSGEVKRSKNATRCQPCDIPACIWLEHSIKPGCGAVERKPKNEEDDDLRSRRSIIRVPKIRRGQVLTRDKHFINSSRRLYYDRILS